jgi:hypothetical protein
VTRGAARTVNNPPAVRTAAPLAPELPHHGSGGRPPGKLTYASEAYEPSVSRSQYALRRDTAPSSGPMMSWP